MSSVYDTLAKLTPWDVDKPKIRIGRAADGGYILLDNFAPSQAVLSFGIGREITFDTEMAERGHTVYMFDHTITSPPATHPRFMFFREGIAGTSDPSKNLYSLEQHLERRKIRGGNLILKMDVEGYEWDAFHNMDSSVLGRFDQILLEVHGLGKLSSASYRVKVDTVLRKLNEQFTLFHVHGNNSQGVALVNGFTVCNLLELSYVRTSLVTRRPSQTCYPTEIDHPNVVASHDVMLWFFPFIPAAVAPSLFGMSAEKSDQEYRMAMMRTETTRLKREAAAKGVSIDKSPS